ncbi:MAG: hypothetical protein ACRDP3_13855 [Streptomyces sp.]|uniref:hypothetical protein n=1 Tax=Streptomyces sp. TaxID=1931 RepID=UPI003D6A65F3
MIHFDADDQRWVDYEADALRAQRHKESARQQRQALKGAFAVLAVCGFVFGTWALGWKDEPQPPPRAQPQPTSTASGSTTPSPTDDPVTGPDDEPGASSSAIAPAGYELVVDPEGFSVAVPEGWDRRAQDGDNGSQVVFYEDSDASRQVQIFWVEDADPYASLKLAEKNAERNKDYDRDALDRLDSGDGAAARLEYTYDSEDHGGTRHVIDHRFEAEDGELYAIIAYGQTEDGGAEVEKELLDTALTYFCPSGAECGNGVSPSGP